MDCTNLSRRGFLAGLGALLATPARANAPRIVSLDYAVASTMIALGAPPLAVPATEQWETWVVEPPLPEDIVNLGSMLEVNFEVLQALKPDRIFSSPYQEALRPYLERIAPVESFVVHNTGSAPYKPIIEATREIAAILGREAAAETLIARAEDTFVEAGRRCGPLRERPLFFVNFMDPYHVRVYGRNCIFQDAMDRMGLVNAWEGSTNGWGFATVGVEELAGVEDSHLFYLDPMPPDVLPSLERSPLWRQMPFVRHDRVDNLPPVLMFGALPAMIRFAGLVAEIGARDGA